MGENNAQTTDFIFKARHDPSEACLRSDGQLWLNAGIKLQARYIRSLERAGIKHVYIEDPLLHDVPDEVVSQDEDYSH